MPRGTWAMWGFVVLLSACGSAEPAGRVVTFPSSAVGEEAEVLSIQLERFQAEHPDIRVEQRATPDASDRRRQLYVQWLNAGAPDPDVLQLDVIWTPEFAAAGWILPLDGFSPDTSDFFPATLAANRFRHQLYALPWFVDVGMLYWRTDLLSSAPPTFEDLARASREVPAREGLSHGFVWQGARYEGLVTVFLEVLGGFGGRILDEGGAVVVDSAQAVAALRWLRDAVGETGISPREVTTWQEEQVRFAFQNGQAVFMRNWPYAVPLLEDPEDSRVAGRFAVAPMPAAPGGEPTAALGGSQLAINARSDDPEAAWAVIEFLSRPEQMTDRARRVGQYPTRRSLYAGETLAGALAVAPAEAARVIERARPRPVTPVYSELSELLQVQLHRALVGEQGAEEALSEAAESIRQLFRDRGLAAGPRPGPDE